MGSISSSIKVNDMMSSAFDRMSNSLNRVIGNMDRLDSQLNAEMPADKVADVRAGIEGCGSAMEDVAERLDLSAEAIEECTRGTQELSGRLDQSADAAADIREETKGGASAMDGLAGAAGSLLSYLSAAAAIRFSKSWVSDALGLADVQNNAERQLESVLKNVGSTSEAFEQLKKKAADIQGMTIYGDEAMLAGAAEFATYLSDTSAIEVMMNTLADYAMGMSGGGEVAASAMVDYATQLGKALNGSYDGLTKKGFELTDAQKEVIENGTDMQKALVISEVISESWDGLAEQMSDLPAGKIIQVKNSLGDMKEELGNRLYPAVASVYETIEEHMPQIQALAERFNDTLVVIIEHAGELLGSAIDIASAIVDNWSSIEPVVYGIVGAYAAWRVATLAQDIAQAALNSTLSVSPLGIICAAIGVVIGLFTAWANKVGSFEVAWLICMDKIKTGWDYFSFGVQVGGAAIMLSLNKIEYGATWLVYKLIDGVDYLDSKIVLGLQKTANTCRDIINGFLKMVNKIPGVNIELMEHVTWGTEISAYHEAQTQARADELAQMKEDMESYRQTKIDELNNVLLNAKTDHAGRLLEIASAQGALLNGDGILSADEKSEIWDTTQNIAENVSEIAESLTANSEELKWLLDIAERDTINRFTTAQVKVELGGIKNYVNEKQDLDGIVNYIAENVEEQLAIAAEACNI